MRFRFVMVLVMAALVMAALVAPRADALATVGSGSCNEANNGNSPDPAYCTFADGAASTAVIGANSCTTPSSCLSLGSNTQIGDNSCAGTSACNFNGGSGGTAIVGDGSCLGVAACSGNGFSGYGAVGDASCIGNSACFANGDINGHGVIGDYACNGDAGTGDICYSNDGTIGDCEGNTVEVPACTAVPCSPGSYSGTGNTPCEPAPAGYFVAVSGALAPTACPLGKYQPDAGQVSCITADAGYFVDSPASVAQQPCLPGTYQPLEGQTSCIAADPGYFVDSEGSAAQQACAPGTWSAAGASYCSPYNEALADALSAAGLQKGGKSLLAQASSIANAPNAASKAGKLKAFINHVNALRGGGLTDEEADNLIALAENI